jgi:sulfite reductase (NADPH) flavoprotein alpha-component
MIATKKIQKQNRASKAIARSIDILTDEISRTAAVDYSKITDFVDKNAFFPLPTDATADVIIVGSIGNVAAVDTFLKDRRATGATGRNWYLLEHKAFMRDVNYQAELGKYYSEHLINRLDVVYPNRHCQSIEIHTRLWEKSRAIFEWLEQGAYFFVGSVSPQVETTLIQIIRHEGNYTTEQATFYVQNLKNTGRFASQVTLVFETIQQLLRA